MNPIEKLHQSGQSIWYDNIERRMLQNGEMEKMIDNGEIRGVTSNPSIFQNAIAKSSDYDSAIQPMAWSDWTSEDIFFQLAIEDIQKTADLFLPLYEKSSGGDGYVSLEVNPRFAYDTDKTFEQVKELWVKVNRKNLMIKIPATKEGLPAIRKAISEGININITLIFSVNRYEEVIDAYLSGLEDRIQKDLPVENIASVASFFVSRVDTKIDSLLINLQKEGKINKDQYHFLRGKAAIANSKLAYEVFEIIFSEDRFKKLASKGARIQRPLWASTSTKNPEYSDVLYVEELIAENTVNTIPPHTLEAFKNHGNVAINIRKDISGAKELFSTLHSIGIDIENVTQTLEFEGVSAFEKAFESLLDTIENRKSGFRRQLFGLAKNVREQVVKLNTESIVNRIYQKDPTVWTDKTLKADEIQNRLGWLEAPFVSDDFINEILSIRDELVEEGFTHALLLGMGGSSLASEVISLSFRGYAEGLELSILDSTHPQQVKISDLKNPKGKTIYIVSSKSGGTTEVQAFLHYFYKEMTEFAGDRAGDYFIAITDPGTELVRQAKEFKFRKVVLADSTVGGRFSALIAFGLVPAALAGVEIKTFLERTKEFTSACRPEVPSGRNPGLILGAIMAEATKLGMDKLTIIAEEPYRSFGSWLEQLIAESSGKEGKGIIPIDIEPFVPLQKYSKDRLFVYIKNDGIFNEKIQEFQDAGFPVIMYEISDPYELGAEFFRWEFAIAVACGILGVNAFNQPDVQDNKNRTKEKINEFKQSGMFNFDKPVLQTDQFDLFTNASLENLEKNSIPEIVENFLKNQKVGDYIAINAYLPRIQDVEQELQEFRKHILLKTEKATTLGFGPRFLHSTGQLHKGGPDKGVFIQIIDSPEKDLDIPEMGLTFGNLIFAQALGDYESLVGRNRRIIRIHLKDAKIRDLWQK